MSEEVKKLLEEAKVADHFAATGERPPGAEEIAKAEESAQAEENAAIEAERQATVDQGERIAGQVAGALDMAVGFLKPMFPSLGVIYTEEVIIGVGQAVAPVALKHQWDVPGLFKEYQEEIALGAVVIPLGYATYKGVLHDLAANDPAPGDGSTGGDGSSGSPGDAPPCGGKVHTLEPRSDG